MLLRKQGVIWMGTKAHDQTLETYHSVLRYWDRTLEAGADQNLEDFGPSQ